MKARCERREPDSIIVTREYLASPERVWEAWTKPELLVQWFGTPGYTLEQASIDLRPGGLYEKRFRTDEGERFIVEGEFREVVECARLVYTWSARRSQLAVSDSLVTLEFAPSGSGTRLTLRHDGLVSEPLLRVHEAGWIGNLDQLAAFTESDQE